MYRSYSAVLLFLAAAAACLNTGCSRAGDTVEKNTRKTAVAGETELSEKDTFFGGGMVHGATLLSDGENTEFSYELPILSMQKTDPDNIIVTDLQVSGEGDRRITFEDCTFGDYYKGWYYYYLHMKVSVSQEKPAAFSIDGIDLEIDGSPYVYTPAKMVFYNTEGLYGKNIPDDSGILLYSEPPEVILNQIPDDADNPASLFLEVNEDCFLSEIRALDFLDITDITYKVNDTAVTFKNGKIPLKKGDILEISYCLSYQDGLSGTDLIKTSRIFSYEDEKENQYILNDPQGFLIVGFEGDQMIKNYIEHELL